MYKLALCILVSAAFIQLARSDVECFYQKIIPRAVAIGALYPQEGRLCAEYPKQFEGIRDDIKECKVNKVKVDALESLMKDFCTNEDLKKEFDAKKTCLWDKFTAGPSCMPKPKETKNVKEAMKYECDNIAKTLECVISDVGKPCEAEALTKKLVDAAKVTYDGWCAEVNGASVNKVFFWSLISSILVAMMFGKQRI